MNEIEQLESRISKLSAEDLALFRAWFRAFDAEHAGGGASITDDKLVDESLADYGSGELGTDAPQPETLAGALRRAAAARH
jgi:hypothetical protein